MLTPTRAASPHLRPAGPARRERPGSGRKARTAAWALGVALCGIFAPCGVQAQQSSPLHAFADLVVGTWEAEDSRHVLEWGLGQRYVRSRSYFPGDDGWALVSEGMWWWDEGAGAIKGVAFAVSMPVARFEYTTRVEGSTIVHGLRAFGEMAGEMTEVWRVGPEEYRWELLQPGPDGDTPLMGGRYRRVR